MTEGNGSAGFWSKLLGGLFGQKDPNEIDPRKGNEQTGKAAGMEGAAALIEGFQKAEADRQDYNRELAFRNAQMQQAYQNNLPAMFKVRQDARRSANALASLGGL